jgi:hypothetical protein
MPIPLINTMQKWLFKSYCRDLTCSLNAFLRSCHGNIWALQLVALRQERRRTLGGADAPLKRLRGGESFFVWGKTQMQDLTLFVKIVWLPGGSGTVVWRLCFGDRVC